MSDCQSCSMPLKRDPQGGGTNADGSKSGKYCSLCYADGRFTAPDMTLDMMQAKVKSKMQEFGFPGFLAGMFTGRVARLERWRKP